MSREPSAFRDIASLHATFQIRSTCRSSRSRGATDRSRHPRRRAHKHRTLDDQLDGAGAHPGLKSLADRDRALMRRLVATILRRLGTLGHVLSRLLDRGIPTDAPRAQSALLIGAAQILWMDVPDHAAVDLSVRLVQSDRRAAKYAGLVNAVLRRCAREGQPLIDEVKSQNLDIPPWLLARWIAAYGETTARQMALAIGHEPRSTSP